LHQSEEIIEDSNEAEEVPFDIDADDDAVLDAILVPIEKPEPEITVEEDLLPPGLLDEAVMKYTDPAGNTFEAPIVRSLEPTPEDYAQFELEEANLEVLEPKKEIVIDTTADFDLDFNTEEPEEDEDNVPDFF
jgi:hypothetical protein